MKQFLVLDSLRGLCALAIVVHHLHVERSITELAFFRNASQFAGFFFALSGFLIYRRYISDLKTSQQLSGYVTTRICRVLPLHAAVLLFFVGFECLKLVLDRYGMSLNTQPFAGDRAPGEILPNLLLLQAWWPGTNALSFNYPSWLVSVQFYLWMIFGLIAYALPGLARKVLSLLCLLAFLALYKDLELIPGNLLWGTACFFAGAISYRIYRRVQDSMPGPLIASVMEVAVLAAIFWLINDGEQSWTIGLSLLFCVAIVIFAHGAGMVSRVLSRGMLPKVGTLWLSIYLTHAAVIMVMTTTLTVVSKYGGHSLMWDRPGETTGTLVRYVSTGSAISDNLLILLVVIVVIGLSFLTHRYIELPGIRLGKRWRHGLREVHEEQPPQEQA